MTKIMRSHLAILVGFRQFWRAASTAALALCLSADAHAQQEQQDQHPDQQEGDQRQQSQEAPPRPTYAPQDADKPPYSHDRQRQNPPDRQFQDAPRVFHARTQSGKTIFP